MASHKIYLSTDAADAAAAAAAAKQPTMSVVAGADTAPATTQTLSPPRSSMRRMTSPPLLTRGPLYQWARCNLWLRASRVWRHPRDLREACRRSNVSQTSLKCRSNVVGHRPHLTLTPGPSGLSMASCPDRTNEPPTYENDFSTSNGLIQPD